MMRFHVLAGVIIVAFVCAAGCERVDQAVDTYQKVKELKSDFQKKSDEAEKAIADKSEDYKDRIRKKVGLVHGEQGKDNADPESEGGRNGGR